MEETNFNITIVGLGLIGGSLAMALKELRPKNIWGIDINANAIQFAEEQGIVNKGYINPEIPLSNSDIVIVCLYPNATIQFIKDNLKNFKEGTIITDTAGIKNKLINEIEKFLPDTIDFIGGHPMTGKECKGIEHASKDIFIDANYIITPTKKNKNLNIKIIEDIALKIGCKRVVKVSPKKHDEIIAYTSQLPHILASALVNSDINDDTKLFVGGSFNDATRVATVNADLWLELIMENKDNIIKCIDVFERRIKSIKNAIEESNNNDLEAIFNSGTIKKEMMLDNKDLF